MSPDNQGSTVLCCENLKITEQVPVVQTMDSAIHQINDYALDK